MTRKQAMSNAIKELCMWILSLVILIPVAMLLLNSVKNVTESAAMSLKLPTSFHFENFATVFKDGNILRSFWNSLLISTLTSLITIVTSSMAAFVMTRNRTRINRYLYYLFLIGLIVPMNYITTMKVLQILHIINTFTGIILLYSATFIPFTVFLFYGFVSGIPKELDESAVMDGSGGGGLFFRIIFPLMKPVTVTALIINFLNCWNDFVLPLYFLNSSAKWGMIMTMYNYFSQYISSWNLVSAAMLINLVPILAVYVLGQKYIISGMTAGAVKG
ncbi:MULTISPECIES: carbohydrate ABC transporter permease [Paenibacillus]|uniref:Sugar ABC transporter permease n=1 Tax=Paenibacillus albilobatus TaxID=2716884 RepID=A0A919XFS9_9BACL|nr:MULTISPECIES: carbohydrate ABC transporter permease [Paenibacillus]GIO29628.1 sugar ABC transporter permease [Paenibacillus albilobatus]